jgi:membrane-bound metal-dependent hydrolase YbcI (DUF457 family)
MPDGGTHLIAGAVCGAFSSLVIQERLHENKQLDPVHLLLSTGTGAAVSRLPDILEPAVYPNHRAFFHSFAFGAALGFSAFQTWNRIKKKRAERRTLGIEQLSGTEILLGFVLIVIIAVLLHLLMDGFTKKGLPII